MPAQKVPLNDRQLATIDAYFINGFVKEKAMVTGGYSTKTARTRPEIVFDNPKIVRPYPSLRRLVRTGSCSGTSRAQQMKSCRW